MLFCALTPGMEVQTGTVAVSIADTTVMTVDAQIDQMNITYVKPGMMCQVSQWGRGNEPDMFMGIIESVSLEGKFENGYSYYPAVIKVDNPEGRMMSGMYVDYSLVASQSDNTLLVPVQAVKYTDGGTCLFIEAPTKPENALDAEAFALEVPEGFLRRAGHGRPVGQLLRGDPRRRPGRDGRLHPVHDGQRQLLYGRRHDVYGLGLGVGH